MSMKLSPASIDYIPSAAVLHFPTFGFSDSPHESFVSLQTLVLQQHHTEQQAFYQQRKEAWRAWTRDTWNLNSKKIYQLVKGKLVESFTYLYHEDRLSTDRKQIEEILQSSWRSIFSKYPRKENKGIQYRDSFYSSVSPYSVTHFPPVTLDDMHYVTVLKKKLKRNTATGIDGWRAHELPCLTVCWLHYLISFICPNNADISLHLFINHMLPWFLKVRRATYYCFCLSLSCVC